MKYATFLLGAVATATLVKAAAYPAPAAFPSVYDDCDDEPISSAPHSVAPVSVHPSSSKAAAVPVSSKAAAVPVSSKAAAVPVSSKAAGVPHSSGKAASAPTSSALLAGHGGHGHWGKPIVITETVIIVVPTYTRACHGPTTVTEGTTTITVTEATTITFLNGPYTRTKYDLTCYTTTTEFFYETECAGWPYATGEGYPPMTVYPTVYITDYTTEYVGAAPTGVAAVPAPPAPAVYPVGSAYPVPAASGSVPPKNLPVFTSGASQAQAGVLALIAGVVAVLVL